MGMKLGCRRPRAAAGAAEARQPMARRSPRPPGAAGQGRRPASEHFGDALLQGRSGAPAPLRDTQPVPAGKGPCAPGSWLQPGRPEHVRLRPHPRARPCTWRPSPGARGAPAEQRRSQRCGQSGRHREPLCPHRRMRVGTRRLARGRSRPGGLPALPVTLLSPASPACFTRHTCLCHQHR